MRNGMSLYRRKQLSFNNAAKGNGLNVGYTLRPNSWDIILLPGRTFLPFQLTGFALTVIAKQNFGKAALLLRVEASVQLLGSVGEFLSVVGTLDLGIGVLSHFIQCVERAVLLRASVSYGDPAI